MEQLNWIENYINETKQKWTALSDFVWDNPEIRFEEFASARYLAEGLEKEGFTVHTNIANIETAFYAEYKQGVGGPVIAFLGEYDALPNLSQESGVTEKTPIMENAYGHGCGHNLLGAGSLAAAVTLKDYIEKHGIDVTVRYYGCPAEEGGSGKTFMARAGAFDDVSLALTWHPASINGVWGFSTLANIQATFKFTEKSSHAAASPHLGRSALDAVELMNIGMNYLREHIVPDAKVHYAVTNTGGESPNVVQANAEVIQLIRAPRVDQALDILERVKKIAHGAALMTETSVEMKLDKAVSNYIPNDTLNRMLGEAMAELGAPAFTDEEQQLAKQFQATLTKQELCAGNQGIPGIEFALQKPLSDINIPYFKTNHVLPGSTDVGDVSWITTMAQCVVATTAVGTPLHTWQMVAQGKTSYAHKGMLHVAKILSLTAVKALANQSIIDRAKEELATFVGDRGYVCPIPVYVEPNSPKGKLETIYKI